MSEAKALANIFNRDIWQTAGIPHADLTWLRHNKPVARYDGDGFDPLIVLTRYRDIVSISRNTKLWSSIPRGIVEHPKGVPQQLRSIVQMDPPEHSKYRAIIQSWLTPRALASLQSELERSARSLVDAMAEKSESDFVEDVATLHPLRMICMLLGLPEEERTILRLSKGLFAASDEEMSDAGSHMEGISRAVAYCVELAEKRQDQPTQDLASAIANAEIDGKPIELHEVISHLLVMISAGHDTTASTISGGLKAFIEHPDQLKQLTTDLSGIGLATEEIIRWTTPTTNFLRTATADTEVREVPIKAGENVYLSYASANRDEEIFDHPFTFDISRKPNHHLAFGIGAHACIGQVLARMEIKSLFTELLPRLKHVEIVGEPRYVKAVWVQNLKSLPIAYEIAPLGGQD